MMNRLVPTTPSTFSPPIIASSKGSRAASSSGVNGSSFKRASPTMLSPFGAGAGVACFLSLETILRSAVKIPPWVCVPKKFGLCWRSSDNATCRASAGQVALSLDLQHNPNFFGTQTQGGIFTALRRMVSNDKKQATPAPAPKGLSIVGEARLKDEPLTPEELA